MVTNCKKCARSTENLVIPRVRARPPVLTSTTCAIERRSLGSGFQTLTCQATVMRVGSRRRVSSFHMLRMTRSARCRLWAPRAFRRDFLSASLSSMKVHGSRVAILGDARDVEHAVDPSLAAEVEARCLTGNPLPSLDQSAKAPVPHQRANSDSRANRNGSPTSAGR